MLPGARLRSRALIAILGCAVLGAGVQLAAPEAASSAVSRHVIRPGNPCHRSAIDVPSCGVLWGMFKPKAPVPGQSRWSARYPATERKIHRRLDLVKDYVDWRPGDRFPSRTDRRLAHHHRTLYFSWNPVNFANRHSVSYASIARGAWDKSVVRPEARYLKRFHRRVFIDFSHEFDAHAAVRYGSSRQFAAAYRHIVHVMRQVGVHNVIWSWVSTGWIGNKAAIRAGFPGRKYVDWVGYDPYNFAQCTGGVWRTPYATFRPFYRWTRHQPGMRHKPLLISEYGSAPGPRVKHWYASIPNALRRLPRIRALIQFSGPTVTPCSVQLGASPGALAGFIDAAHAPAVIGR